MTTTASTTVSGTGAGQPRLHGPQAWIVTLQDVDPAGTDHAVTVGTSTLNR